LEGRISTSKTPGKQPAKVAATLEAKERTTGNIQKGRNKKLHHQLFLKDDKKNRLSQKQPDVSSTIDDCASNSFKKLRSGKQVMV
jgi:hypothetical protein